MAFSFKFYKLLLYVAILFSAILLILGYYLNESFFLQYSVDKEISSQTIAKIQKLKNYLY